MLKVVDSQIIIVDASNVSSMKLSHEVENEIDMSANYSRGSGTKSKKINQKPQIIIFRKRFGPKIINEKNVNEHVRAQVIAIETIYIMYQTI